MSPITIPAQMTEKESLLAQQQELFIVEKLLSEQALTLNELELILPVPFHVNSMEDTSLIYASKSCCDHFGFDKEELIPFSAEQLASLITPDTLEHVTPRFISFYSERDSHKVYSDFQQIVRRGKAEPEWVFTATKIYNALEAPICLSIPVSQMGNLNKQLSGLLDDNLFIKKNYLKFASLTKQEREILKLIVSGHKRQDIADQLFISVHTYDTHRKNIRKKLETKSLSELIRYANAFGVFEE